MFLPHSGTVQPVFGQFFFPGGPGWTWIRAYTKKGQWAFIKGCLHRHFFPPFVNLGSASLIIVSVRWPTILSSGGPSREVPPGFFGPRRQFFFTPHLQSPPPAHHPSCADITDDRAHPGAPPYQRCPFFDHCVGDNDLLSEKVDSR